jgi:hypothetical protein
MDTPWVYRFEPGSGFCPKASPERVASGWRKRRVKSSGGTAQEWDNGQATVTSSVSTSPIIVNFFNALNQFSLREIKSLQIIEMTLHITNNVIHITIHAPLRVA